MANTFQQSLASKLPPHLMPGNVGQYNKVTWPFWFPIEFNFGTDPDYGSHTRQTRSFQVGQEAAFLLMAITRKSYSYDSAGELAPLQLEIRDRQSTRQLNERAFPIQMIGTNSNPTILPTPFLVMPASWMDITLSTWLPAAHNRVTGDGRHHFTFFGYRVRTEDANKVLSSVFAG